MDLRPDLLLHPNLPKPLHGLNPRTIKGDLWWDKVRQQAYAKNDYKCWACGVHKSEAKFHHWLEAHEDYDFDYVKGTLQIREIVALCHACHNFIHSGRLANLHAQGKLKKDYFEEVLLHGSAVLVSAKLPLNCFAIRAEQVLNSSRVTEAFDLHFKLYDRNEFPVSNVKWSDWRMILEGVAYKPLFESEKEWAKHYGVTI